MKGSEVAEFYNGRSLFITGATGLMGKVLLEKLLYCCPGVENIYFLIRPKRGKAIETRVEDMIKLPLFNRVRQQCPERLKKLVPMSGDVTVDGLGLSEENKKALIDKVSVVIHGAATLIRHEAKLRDTINLNTAGTLRVFNLAKQFTKLKVILHMSTAFCHVDIDVMEEKVYPCPHNPVDVIDLCNWMDDEALEHVTHKLIEPHPNTYTYSKRLAEVIAANHFSEMPVAIIRPSIVCPAHSEPLKGWVDNLNGPVGILIGAGKGVIRSMHCNGQYHAEVIPVDMAINGVLAIGWKIGSMETKPKEVPVFNLTQSETNLITWGEVLEKGRRSCYENPFEMMLWYPDGNIRKSKFVQKLYSVFCHWLPAYFIDFLMIIFGQKPFMLHVQSRIADGLQVLQYFTTREWVFSNKNLLDMRASFNNVDKEVFTMDFEGINPAEYLTICILGARQYILKESLDTLPRCRRNLKLLWLLDRSVKLLFIVFIVWYLLSRFSSVRSVFSTITSNFMQPVKI